MALPVLQWVYYRKLLSNFFRGEFQNLQENFLLTSTRRKYTQDAQKLVISAFLKKINKPLVIEKKKSTTKLQPGQVKIGVHYCSVNVADHLIWTGQTETTPKLPFVLGFEISGEILELVPKTKRDIVESEDEEELKVGDRVLALNKEHFSGFSSECIVDQKDVFQVPTSVKYETAAALADSYGTAMLGISRRAKLQQGETILITAAAGGLGLAAVDVAANIYKAKVIAVCGTEDKATLVRDKGAWAAFTFKNEKLLKAEVAKASNGRGADVVFEAVGGEIFKSAMECVAPEGKVIVAGFTSRNVPQLPMTSVLFLPSFSLIGVSLLNYRNRMFPVYRRTVMDVIEMCEQGLISPTIAEIFPLKDVSEAFVCLTEKKTTGKVILEITGA